MNNKDEIFSVEKVLAKEKELKEHPERNRVKTVTMTAEELYEKIMKNGGSYDAASLCSLAPSPQGLTNDDEVGAQSADGVSRPSMTE